MTTHTRHHFFQTISQHPAGSMQIFQRHLRQTLKDEPHSALFEAVGSKEKRLYEERNARHYDIYTGEHFKQVIHIQTEWFKTYL